MKLRSTYAAIAALLTVGTANAELISRGGGMVYDTTLNVTWLADMNYAVTSGYAAGGTPFGSLYSVDAVWTDGSMGWSAAKQWASNLTYGGYSDWRLPNLDRPGTDCPFVYCAGGELGHLFVQDLGNQPGTSLLDQSSDTGQQKANLALFDNMQIAVLWYATDSATYADQAFQFAPLVGNEGRYYKYDPRHVMVLRDGDVGATVPEPASLALAGLALAGIAATRRRKQ